jgi:7-cyano-7-deazaguanine synthase
MSKQAIIVASGGMDSATLAWHYKQQGFSVRLVGFDYGQRHRKELSALEKIADRLGGSSTIVPLNLREHLHGSALTSDDVEVPDGHYAQETMKATVVPNRNAIMLSIATGIAVAEGAEVVATGVHAGDHFIYPDCRPAFFHPFAEAMKAANEGFSVEGFRLEAPFITMTKAEIATHGSSLGVDYSITWSCYKGGDIHCGRCGTCVERIEAFLDGGVDDPTEYADREFALAEIGRA